MSSLDLLTGVFLIVLSLLPMVLVGTAAWMLIPSSIWEKRPVLRSLAWLILVLPLLCVLGDVAVSAPHTPDLYIFAVSLLLLSIGAVFTALAVKRRWSAKWPLVALIVAICPIWLGLTIIVGMIGLGKLLIWWFGRGGTIAGSRMKSTGPTARPVGMTESTNNEW